MGNKVDTSQNQYGPHVPLAQNPLDQAADVLDGTFGCHTQHMDEAALKKAADDCRKRHPEMPKNFLVLLRDDDPRWGTVKDLFKNADPNKFYVVSHGDQSQLKSYTDQNHNGFQKVTPDTLASYLIDNHVQSPIELVACKTGQWQDGFASQLSKDLGGQQVSGPVGYSSIRNGQPTSVDGQGHPLDHTENSFG